MHKSLTLNRIVRANLFLRKKNTNAWILTGVSSTIIKQKLISTSTRNSLNIA